MFSFSFHATFRKKKLSIGGESAKLATDQSLREPTHKTGTITKLYVCVCVCFSLKQDLNSRSERHSGILLDFTVILHPFQCLKYQT